MLVKALLSLFVFLTCALSLSAQVINYEIDSSFDSEMLFSRGAIDDLLIHDNGDVLLTGMMANFGSPAGTTSLIDEQGNLIVSLGNSTSLQNLEYYLGSYIHYGGNGLTRFGLPDQTIPPFIFEFNKSIYGVGIPERARDVIILPNNNILVAGRFFTDSTLIGTPDIASGIRQLCLIDSTGAPVPDFPMLRCAAPVQAEIYTLDQLSTGEYIIAGNFLEVDGYAYANIAKLNADFSVDTTFAQVFEPGALTIFTNLVDSQDRIWVGRSVLTPLINEPYNHSGLIRLLPNGVLDTTFNQLVFNGYNSGSLENPGSIAYVSAGVFEDIDGTFILYGDFVDVNGEQNRNIIKVYDSGALIDGAFENTRPDSTTWSNWSHMAGPIMSSSIKDIVRLPDGKLLIGGRFSSFGGEPYSCLVRLQPRGFVGLDENEGRGKLKLWPNPMVLNSGNNSIYLSAPSQPERISTVEIFNLQGQQVLQKQFNAIGAPISITLPALPSGLYVVMAISENTQYTQKLILSNP